MRMWYAHLYVLCSQAKQEHQQNLQTTINIHQFYPFSVNNSFYQQLQMAGPTKTITQQIYPSATSPT